MPATLEYDQLFQTLSQVCLDHENAANAPKLTPADDLGTFDNIWQFLDAPRTVASNVLTQSADLETSPTKQQHKQQKKRERRKHKRCLCHEAREQAARMATLGEDEVPELGNYSSASDSEANVTSSDEETSKETRLQLLRSTLDSATKALQSSGTIAPRRLRPSNRDRTISLHSKLARHFPDIEARRLVASPQPAGIAFHERSSRVLEPKSQTHIFIDSSNIFLGYQDLLQSHYPQSYPAYSFKKPVMDLHALHTILERGRPSAKKELVGSSPLLQSWSPLASHAYNISILERIKTTQDSSSSSTTTTTTTTSTSRKEQGVDELMHLKMMESIVDAEPGIMVLATGDANIAQFSAGFYPVAVKALARGWRVEVVAFSRSVNKLWLELDDRGEYADAFGVIYLDDYLDELESS